ncbi:MAG: cupin domain-containing protein [Solirubrobacteraceae bacterium]
MTELTDPNLDVPDWDVELPDPPFRRRMMRAAHRAGARELGAALYELDPGGAVAPYHVHHGNEELLIVLEGRPALRTPAGTRHLDPGAVVSFPRGERGAHRVTNPGPAAARLLIVSTVNFPEVAEYPDTGTVMAMIEPEAGWAFPSDAAVPFKQRVVEAMQAGDERAAGG